jgi:hypothetical protein
VRKRLDLDALDLDDPFEPDDGNIPHLAKHAPFNADDTLDAWTFGQPLFYPAAEDGPADWLMAARIPGRSSSCRSRRRGAVIHGRAARSASISRVVH